MKQMLKDVIALSPYRVVRDRAANRFQAAETCLAAMKDRGFSPAIVIDGGANVGEFSLSASAIFPAAEFHMIEPQEACYAPLRRLCASHGFKLHESALAENRGFVEFSKTDKPSTGAHVQPNTSAQSVRRPAETLDHLFGDVTAEQRPLLKLDLQGYELHALRVA